MKIFLVEDPLVSRGQLAAMLALRPDLVLLDVHLAEGSGFDVLNAVHVNAPEIDLCSELERVRELVAQRVAIKPASQPPSRKPL